MSIEPTPVDPTSPYSAEQFNIHDAKTQLSRLIERVERGEEIVISRAGTPVAKLVPLARVPRRTGRGSLRGRLVLADDWDSAATNEQISRDFEPADGGPADVEPAP